MKVFVYGTLQRGQPNFQLFDDTKDGCYKYLGVGMTTKKYPLVIASKFNIPFMLPVEGTGNEKIQANVLETEEGRDIDTSDHIRKLAQTRVDQKKYNLWDDWETRNILSKIKGEVYEVDDRILKVLDELERHPTFYRREMIPVTSEDGSTLDCGCYLLFNFREDLLKLPFYDTYDSKGSHDLPYVPRSSRDGEKNYNFISSVKNVD